MKYLNRVLIHNLCWAAAILLIAWLFPDNTYANKGLFLILGLWFCSYSWLKKSQCRQSGNTSCSNKACRN